MKKKLLLFAVAAVLLFGYAAYSEYGPRQVPNGQPGLVRIHAGNVDTLRAQFNQAADRVRVLTLLSPT